MTKTATRVERKSRKQSTSALEPTNPVATVGDATTAIFLLSDYERFGLSERVCYHFDLTEALFNTDGPATTTTTTTPFPMDAHSNVCGVVSLLECAPLIPWHRLNKHHKKALKQQLQIFNAQAQKVRQEKSTLSYQPSKLPLRLNPSTRMFFAYEVTRIAFCVDASPSLTSTFGIAGSSHNKCCCPLDNLPEMARTFFRSLVQPVSSSSFDPGIWRPQLAVSVLAVYPLGKTTETSLLVRDYRVDSLESAQILADRIEEWCKTEVEMGIAERISRRHAANTWAAPLYLYSSSLRDILEAADYALSVLSSEARPCIVVATDGRSVSCDGIMDVFVHVDRVDIPIIVLDLSNSETHIPFSKEEPCMQSVSDENQPNFLTYDPGNPSAFPLHLSDDTEALYGICRSTGGCFLDAQLLAEASQSTAGQQVSSAETPLSSDHYHSFKRRFVKMNGVQWLTLLSLSPLSPTFHSSWGKLVPPAYLKRRLSIGMVDAPAVKEVSDWTSLLSSRHESFSRQGSSDLRPRGPAIGEVSMRRSHAHNRVTFSTYVFSPIRIKSLLLMRIKEGYRAKQYGQSTQDSDKVFIQFTLPLELGTILHYELSYKALPNQSPLVGSAHVKIELSGDPGFIQSVKNDFLRQFPNGRPLNMAQKVSAKLCKVLHWIRKEDCLQSYLCPPLQWSDQLSSPDTPFVRRLGTLSPLQRCRHFQVTEFDVVCTGRMPYAYDDDDFLSEFMAVDNGEQELVDEISEWSTQTITEKSKYIKQTDTSDDMNGYCVIEIRRSPSTSRLFTISIETKGGSNPGDRQATIASLKAALGELKDVEVLVKQMGPFLIGTAGPSTSQGHNVALQYHQATWDLIKDPELLPLLMKRRTEIGFFRLLKSSDDHAIFAKVVPEVLTSSPGDLVQYQFAIMDDKVVINLQMECECGTFFPFARLVEGSLESRFHRMVHILRRRDQECGRALRSRTNLLQVFKSDSDSPLIKEAHLDSVKRLRQYSSRVSRKLRFFNTDAGVANDILFQITVNLLLSESLGARAAKLAIDPNALVKDNGPGEWFILQFDRHTMSLVHLSLEDEVGKIGETTDCTFRELTFFTIGISDLYSKRDDIVDDDSVDSHISEYLCVTEFADLFEAAQKKNLSAASYLALRSSALPAVESFEEGDFAEVLSACTFVEAASVLIPAVSSTTDTETIREDESKLAQVIRTVLRPVPGNQQCFFYCGIGDVEELMRIDTHDSDDSLSSVDGESEISGEQQSANCDDDLEADENRTHTFDDGLTSVDSLSLDGDCNAETGMSNLVSPPIFVKFTLDGKPATVRDIYSITTSTNLAVHISVFESSMKLTRGSRTAYHPQVPWSHQTVCLEITTLLKSYVAEQTIERLRHVGSSISDDDLKLVKTCLNRVRSVVSFSSDVYFYVSKTELMVPSSAPAGGESEVEEGFRILNTELRNNGTFNLKSVTGGGFMVADTVSFDQSLECWCFVKVNKNEGLVSAQAYHPEGEQKATEVMSNIHAVVRSCVHRVNQQLLLKSLHGSRTASSLLLVNEDKKIEGPEERGHVPERFYPGVFKCPLVFRTVFDLYHRCATNPNQVARTLEGTVLHSFAVSNRRGIFVYKDETGAIFYLSLQATSGGNDNDGKIQLLVHGVHEPGPSVTMQLRMLLQRRLLLIAVDMLSSVLTKNPHFNWKQADLDFIRSFETEWTSLEETSETSQQDFIYEFPSHVYDPLLVLLIFRQNICGSTFFQPVHDTGGEAKSIPSTSATEDNIPDADGVIIDFNKKDFTLYYNNAASKLDPAFQGVSTLTDSGANFCRLGGTGIAIIEFSLVYSDGTPIKKVKIGQAANSEESVISVPIEALRFRSLDHFVEGRHSFCVKVRVIDTALKRKYLHAWIALTLNQALIGWAIERQIERSQLGMLRPLYEENEKAGERRAFITDIERKSVVDSYSPGLPALNSVLESSHDLPHPAVARIHNEGVIRSSSVATATLEYLENCILTPILSESKAPVALETAKANMTVIRLSRSEKPRLVKLAWDKPRRHALVSLISGDANSQAMIRDSPIDCPEYICFYCVNEYGRDEEDSNSPPKVYREVVLDDRANERSASMELLQECKRKNPRVFRRSFAFIFSVKRNRRSLWAYNWTSQVLKSVATQLNDADRSFLLAARRSTAALQLRSLKILSPDSSRLKDPAGTRKTVASKSSKAPSPKSKKQSVAPEVARNADPDNRQKDAESRGSETGPTRKIRRPVNMRRPKLIGKSVEGAAMQAVAASRTRASTNRFKTPPPPTQPKRPPRESGPARDTIKAAPLRKPAPKSDSSLTESSRSPQGFRSQKEPQKRDDILSRVLNDFRLLSSSNTSITRRLSSLQREALLALSNVWWPRKDRQTIPKSVGEFLLSKSPIAWSDACFIPPLPTRMTDIFPLAFSNWIAAWTPGLDILPLSTTNIPSKLPDSVLLSSEIKNVRGCKCLAVVRITRMRGSKTGKKKAIVRSEGWILNLPRRSKMDQIRKLDSNATSMLSKEKDSAGMDKLVSDLHGSIVLRSLLFDFSASIVERTIRLLDTKVDYKELIPIVRTLMARYPYEHQKRMPMLNYRAFEATIVLRSYRDRLINMFDATALFERLYSEADVRDVVQCGVGLCFKKGISVRGCHSLCFLTRHPADASKMQLVILCRTQGRDLAEFMFREGSDVAIHILDNIAVEAASLAYKELRFVSEKLRKDALWKSLSSKESKRLVSPEQGIKEMLDLATVRPLSQLLGNHFIGTSSELATLLGPDSGIDWAMCTLAMKKDAAFSPNWSLEGEDELVTSLFYSEAEDLFWLIRLDLKGKLLRADLVEKNERVESERRQMALQKFSNFLLHYIWHNL